MHSVRLADRAASPRPQPKMKLAMCGGNLQVASTTEPTEVRTGAPLPDCFVPVCDRPACLYRPDDFTTIPSRCRPSHKIVT